MEESDTRVRMLENDWCTLRSGERIWWRVLMLEQEMVKYSYACESMIKKCTFHKEEIEHYLKV